MEYSYMTADPMLYSKLKKFSRENRSHQTEAEYSLWNELRSGRLGYRFKRQHIIGAYIADFVCLDHKLIVEVDGGYHSQPEQMLLDEHRTQWLEEKGYRVLRFTNDEVTCNLEMIINIIFCKLNEQENDNKR